MTLRSAFKITNRVLRRGFVCRTCGAAFEFPRGPLRADELRLLRAHEFIHAGAQAWSEL